MVQKSISNLWKKGNRMNDLKMTEQTISSLEVADMVEKRHKNLLRDIAKYTYELTELKIEPSEFFRDSTYKDKTGRVLQCFDVTKKGCEFIAHKLTGIKGTEFTAKYINRFHDMEDVIQYGIIRKILCKPAL